MSSPPLKDGRVLLVWQRRPCGLAGSEELTSHLFSTWMHLPTRPESGRGSGVSMIASKIRCEYFRVGSHA